MPNKIACMIFLPDRMKKKMLEFLILLFPGAFANQFSMKGKQENQRSGFKKIVTSSRVQWLLSVIQAFGKLRQEECCDSETSLSYK